MLHGHLMTKAMYFHLSHLAKGEQERAFTEPMCDSWKKASSRLRTGGYISRNKISMDMEEEKENVKRKKIMIKRKIKIK